MRAFLVLGPAEAVVEMGVFVAVLVHGGWVYGTVPGAELLALRRGRLRDGRARAAGQRLRLPQREPQGRGVVAAGQPPAALGGRRRARFLVVILGWPALATVLGGSMPDLAGWAMALLVVPAVLAADAAHKTVRGGWGRSAMTQGVALSMARRRRNSDRRLARSTLAWAFLSVGESVCSSRRAGRWPELLR